MRRSSRLWLCLLLVVTACGPAESDPPAAQSSAQPIVVPVDRRCPDAPGPIDGAIVFGHDNTLLAIDPGGGEPTTIVQPSVGSFAFEPAWSPDGSTLGYTYAQPPDDPNLQWLPIGQLCALDRATGKGRSLARGGAPLEGMNEAAWLPDGKSLLLTHHRPRLADNGQYLGDQLEIARYDLAAATMTTLVPAGLSASLSPDGARLAFLQFNDQDMSVVLMLAGADGSAPASIPAIEPPLATFATPRWSPDGSTVVFSASGGPAAARLAPTVWDWLPGVRVAHAHGAPADLWLIDADGTNLRRLTRANLDDPHAAWSPNGSEIAVTNGYGGVSIVELSSGQLRTLTQRGNSGGITWRR